MTKRDRAELHVIDVMLSHECFAKTFQISPSEALLLMEQNRFMTSLTRFWLSRHFDVTLRPGPNQKGFFLDRPHKILGSHINTRSFGRNSLKLQVSKKEGFHRRDFYGDADVVNDVNDFDIIAVTDTTQAPRYRIYLVPSVKLSNFIIDNAIGKKGISRSAWNRFIEMTFDPIYHRYHPKIHDSVQIPEIVSAINAQQDDDLMQGVLDL